MQVFISKYALAAHLSILTVAPLVLLAFFPSVMGGEIMLWLSLIAAIWLLYNPSRRKGEMLHMARRRVFQNFVRDSLFWFCLFLVLFFLVRWLNNGVELEYNSEDSAWRLSEAVVPFLPTAVNPSGFFEFASSIAFGIVVMGAKYCLGRKARSFFLVFTSFLASFVALAFFLCYVCNVESFVQMAKCPKAVYSNVGVALYIYAIGTLFAFSNCIEVHWGRNIFFLILSMMALLVCAFVYSSPFEIFSFSIAFVAGFVILVGLSVFLYSTVSAFKISISVLFSIALAVGVLMSVLPHEVLVQKMPYFFNQSLFPEGFLAERGVLSDVSLRIWGAKKWLGGGLGSFPLELKFAATASDFQFIGLMQACPLNGYWHLICENGLIGISICVIVLALGVTVLFYRAARAIVHLIRNTEDEESFADFVSLVSLLPIVVVIPISVCAFVSSSFLRIDVILPLGAFFALGISSIRSDYSSK